MLSVVLIHRLVRDALAAEDEVKIHRIVDCLTQDFAHSVVSNSRNGGLIGLAAVAIALGTVWVC